jgi:hypothetical protein
VGNSKVAGATPKQADPEVSTDARSSDSYQSSLLRRSSMASRPGRRRQIWRFADLRVPAAAPLQNPAYLHGVRRAQRDYLALEMEREGVLKHRRAWQFVWVGLEGRRQNPAHADDASRRFVSARRGVPTSQTAAGHITLASARH